MSNFYCAAPWRGLHINTNGDIKTCCAGNPNMLGNLNHYSIEDILNGPKLKEIRESLRQGQSHPYCVNCIDRENVNGESERSWHNNINEDFDFTQAGLEYEFPTLIDIRWNSTCNLSCNYCNAYDSSKWATLRGLPVRNNTRQYYQNVCDFIEKHNDHIQEVALVGGEPLLLPENERLLEVIPKDCIVTLITNLNNPLENNRIFKKLVDRQRVGWSMSFDNIGERFEYVRYGASWDLQQHNLALIQDLMKNNGHWGGIHAVYNLYNATRLVEFKQFAEQHGLSIKWQNLGSPPPPLNARYYGNEITTLAAQEIERVFALCKIDKQEEEFFTTALAHYQSVTEPNTKMLDELRQFVDDIEYKYHPDSQGQFRRLWPEFGGILWP